MGCAFNKPEQARSSEAKKQETPKGHIVNSKKAKINKEDYMFKERESETLAKESGYSAQIANAR